MANSYRWPSAEQRFFAAVKFTDTCWEWLGYNVKGYGILRTGPDSRRTFAHRFAYEQMVGPIPSELQIDHLCRNPSCVRPDHLEPVTQRENLLRGETVVAFNLAKTHCKWGHKFTSENTRTYTDGQGTHRRCRDCVRIRQRQYWRAKHWS